MAIANPTLKGSFLLCKKRFLCYFATQNLSVATLKSVVKLQESAIVVKLYLHLHQSRLEKRVNNFLRKVELMFTGKSYNLSLRPDLKAISNCSRATMGAWNECSWILWLNRVWKRVNVAS